MERTNAVRNAIESWRGGAVARLLSDLSHRLTGRGAVPSAARDTHFGDPFWQEPARPQPAARRRRELWLEQGELWRGRDPDETHAEHLPASRPVAERPLREPAPASRRPAGYALVADAPPVTGLTSVVRRERAAARRLDDVAKLLQVNDAVQGMRGSSVLALPRRQFEARCSLWRGNPVGTPFLMGC